MAGFFRRLFHVGDVPEALRSELAAEGITAEFPNLAVGYRFSGRVPGLVALLEKKGYAGLLVFTSQRVVGTLTPGAGRAVDIPWTTGDDGAVQVTIDADGLHVEIDLPRVDPSFEGTQSLHYKVVFSEAFLDSLPKRKFGFDIPREFVLGLAGVPVRA